MTINTILALKKSNTATLSNKVPGQHQQVAAQLSLPQSAVLPMLVTELPPQSHAPPVMLVTEPPQPLQECIDGEYAWRTNVNKMLLINTATQHFYFILTLQLKIDLHKPPTKQ